MAKFQKGIPRPKGAGRKAGTPNKATQNARDVINDIVMGNADKLQMWLDEIYSKEGALSAFKSFTTLLEYFIPKMARTEITGKDGDALYKEPVQLAAEDRELLRRYVANEKGE